ncbi:MAG: hypothetical protein QNJ65_05895 [Xenococcaceae cyanobacterium MO_234.B1]|nr:hypothetical protein [Xenococcaceae cyanobacterium MO_234.B1]
MIKSLLLQDIYCLSGTTETGSLTYQELDTQAVAIAVIKPGTISQTSSGKIQRRGCSKQFLEGTLNIVAQWQQGQAEKVVIDMVNL